MNDMHAKWEEAPKGANAYRYGVWYLVDREDRKARQWLGEKWSMPGRLLFEDLTTSAGVYYRPDDDAPATEPNFGSERTMPNGGDIRAKVEFTLKPFIVPVTVTLREASEAVSIKQLDPEAISALCDDFRARVFRAAGRDDSRREDA